MEDVGRRETLALVMSGGGARAAYQVGALRFLAREFPQFAPEIVTGVSAGAINAAWLASRTDDFADKAASLAELWCSLSPDQVFHVDSWRTARNALRTGLKLVSGGWIKTPPYAALVDTAPLRKLLERLVGDEHGNLKGIAENIARGRLRAAAITASSYSTGQSITWIEGAGFTSWDRAHRKGVPATLTIDHVLASSSLPLFFPAARIGSQWFGDGGIRLTAPLSPAIHLGATRVLAISTRYARTIAEADQPSIERYPPPAQIAGVLFNAIFLDMFDADALTLERVNRLVDLLPDERRGELRRVELMVLRPSRDLGKLANQYEAKLPGAFRFMTRGLGTKETRSNDLLSLVMFQPDYLAALVEIGERDAQARAGEIARFLERV